MNTIQSLELLKTSAENRTKTLTHLKEEFAFLVGSDIKLAVLEVNHDWCKIIGNSVFILKNACSFEIFILHISKVIDISASNWDENH
ncbi:hypothetical protein [Vibrio cionasavignyae]|uniref:hypothetical protein n=1 Tax=Vibrio cionasavignyae TaxID=2910252 RepID=UPI003D11A4DC